MAKFVRAAQLIRQFKQSAAPTVAQGLTVDDIWVDTDDHATYVCTSISPVTFTALGSGGTPGGSNTYVQYNDSSSFGGDSGFTYNKTTHALTITGAMSASNLSGTNTGDQTLPTDATITTTDVTTNNASTSKHGWLKKLDNTATHYMDGTGGWSTPPATITTLTTKGDLFGYDTGNNRIPVGSNYTLLKGDSTATLGVSYDYPDPPLTKSSDVWQCEYAGGNATSNDIVPTSSVSGTGAQILLDTSDTSGATWGVAAPETGSTTTGRAYTSPAGAGMFAAGGQIIFEASCKIPTLSNGTDRFAVSIGLGSSVSSGKFNDGAYFYYRDDVNSGNWQCEIALFGSSGTPHITTTSTAATTNWTRFKIVINAACTSIGFYINDVLVATDATAANLPIATQIRPTCGLLKSAGTTSLKLFVDYQKARKDFMVAR